MGPLPQKARNLADQFSGVLKDKKYLIHDRDPEEQTVCPQREWMAKITAHFCPTNDNSLLA